MDMSEFNEAFQAESEENLQRMNDSLLGLEQDQEDMEHINIMFRSAHTLKGMSATMGFSAIAELTHEMENLMDGIRKGQTRLDESIIDVLFECLDTLEALVGSIEGDQSVDITHLQDRLKKFAELGDGVEQPDEVPESTGPANDAGQGVEEVVPEVDIDFPDKEGDGIEEAMPKELVGSAVKRTEAIKSVQSVRVSIERLDNLMNLVGELVINKIRINQLASDLRSKDLNEAVANLDRLTNEIQNEVMESRMVPIDQVFSRFPRMVRDLAKSNGKVINLVIEGKEIELDRTILDEIGDPLVHLLRNAVDHGIDDPDERSQLGKPEAGLVRLAAARRRNSVIVEVEDDGKGMDPAILRQIAVKKGIMTQEAVNLLSDIDAINLIFAPGFSGAAKITDVSGRGVGMDAVKTKIEALGGNITIESTPGKGSKIQLQLPLTIAIIQSLMVRVADEMYAIPLTNVVRDIWIKSSDIKTISGKEVILLRGEVLPLMRLQEVLQSSIPADENENLVVVVVEKMGNNIGFIVDELLGQQEVLIKALDSKVLKNTRGFAGATILGDGSVALILDVATLV